MQNRDIVVIGASTGGIDALKRLVSNLPQNLPATVFIVQHIAPHSPALLPSILQHVGRLPASTPQDYEEFASGRIYVAPPDRHMLVESSGHIHITRSPRENHSRPAIDPLFRSAALAFGSRVIGVVLTGWLDDGTAGLWAIKERGGIAVVQKPEEAVAPSMPLNALRYVSPHHCVSLDELPALLSNLTTDAAHPAPKGTMPQELELEVNIARGKNPLDLGIINWGEATRFVCPDCHGSLSQLKEGLNVRFRCYTGHGYSSESLLAEFSKKSEESLWNAVRALEERAMLLQQMSATLSGADQQQPQVAALQQHAADSLARAEAVRKILLSDRIPEETVQAPQRRNN